MKNPAAVAALLTLAVIGALIGMLLCDGVWDIVFFALALLPLVWGALSAQASK